jgi:hypothetical protein
MLPPLGLARSVFVLSTVLASWGCSGSPAGPSPALTGVWGGDHIALTVAETGTHIEFDCAHGDIPGSITVNAQNTFDVQGTYVRGYLLSMMRDQRSSLYCHSIHPIGSHKRRLVSCPRPRRLAAADLCPRSRMTEPA